MIRLDPMTGDEFAAYQEASIAVARSPYRKLGYVETNFSMVKRLAED
jgi:hypothetical protein